MNKNINSRKSKLKFSSFKSRSSPKFGEYREVFGSPVAVLVDFFQQLEERTPSCCSTYLPDCGVPWSLHLTCSGHHLSAPTCKLLAGGSQLNLPVMAETAGSICAKMGHFQVFIYSGLRFPRIRVNIQ